MARYIAKRILYMIPVLLGVTLLVFFIMHLAPGNVAGMILGENATPEQIAALEHEMGLDRPLLVQYFDYLVGLLHGDLGTSYTTGDSVTGEIMARFPYTVQLTLVAVCCAMMLGFSGILRIETAAPAGATPAPAPLPSYQEAEQPAVEIVDGEGNYLIPGFVDTHVHVESSMLIPEYNLPQ